MISFDEAQARLAGVARPLGVEWVPLERAAGRVLAEAVVARVDSPPADCSAMDGYAVRLSDLPGSLRVMGEAFAGRAFDRPIEPGCAVRIFTGGQVPQGADCVIIQEHVERTGDMVTVRNSPHGAQHIRPRGSDFQVGRELLPPGTVLSPRAMVAAAGADQAELSVWCRPRAIILSTGDELVAPGEASRLPGTIPESVSYGVAALSEQWGGQIVATRRLSDELASMERAAGEALELADLVIVTGGASVGEKDYAKRMFEPHGLDLVFSKVAIKPGKPVWLGAVRGKLVLGLPGNPTSAMVTARLFLAPLLAGLGGGVCALRWEPRPLAGDLAPCGDRETFARARQTGAGALPIGNQDSSAQHALTQADWLVRCRPHDPPRGPGENVEALAF